VTVNDSVSLRIAAKLTISAWVNPTSRNNYGNLIVQKRNPTQVGTGYNYGFWLYPTSGKLLFEFNDGSYEDMIGTTAVPLNTWTYVTVVVDETAGTKLTFYQNGSVDGTPAYSGTMPSSGAEQLQIGNYGAYDGGPFQFNGSIDEIRIANSTRSAGWIATEYNNQGSPSTFYSVGGQQNSGGGGSSIGVSVSPLGPVTLNQSQTQQFNATVTGTSNTAVTWSINPVVGTVSSSGLYTAPSSIASAQTVTVKATSAADGSKSASSTVNLMLPDYTITVNGLDPLLIDPGSSNATTVVVSPAGGYADTVNLYVANLPIGSSYHWQSSSISNGSGSVILYIDRIPSNTPSGKYLATATGISSHNLTHISQFTIQVTGPPANFTMLATPNFQSVAVGGTASYNVSVNPQSGFTGAVSLSVSGQPSGSSVGCTPSCTITTSGSAMVTVAGLGGAAARTYPLTITGIASSWRQDLPATLVLGPATGQTLSVSPGSVIMTAGQVQNFTASVSGINTPVTWSVSSPGGAVAGRLSSTGSNTSVYTAPSAVVGNQSIVITATSQADNITQGAAQIFEQTAAAQLNVYNDNNPVKYFGGYCTLDCSTVSCSAGSNITATPTDVIPATLTTLSTFNLILTADTSAASGSRTLSCLFPDGSQPNVTLMVWDVTPSITDIIPISIPYPGTNEVTFTGIGFGVDQPTLTLNGVTCSLPESFCPILQGNTPTSFTASVTPPSLGTYPVVVTSSGNGNNFGGPLRSRPQSQLPANLQVVQGDSTPIITSIAPNNLNAGTLSVPVSIFGSGFGTQPVVSVAGNGVSATLDPNTPPTDSQIAALFDVAPNADPTVNVTVNAFGTSTHNFTPTPGSQQTSNSEPVTVTQNSNAIWNVEHRAFIRANWVKSPLGCGPFGVPLPGVSRSMWVRGDNRDFAITPMLTPGLPSGPAYRVRDTVAVAAGIGGPVVQQSGDQGVSREYDTMSLRPDVLHFDPAGSGQIIDPNMIDATRSCNGGFGLVAKGRGVPSLLPAASVALNPRDGTVAVTFRGSASDPNILGSSLLGPIQWNLVVTISSDQSTATIIGSHTCFPAHEVIINGRIVSSTEGEVLWQYGPNYGNGASGSTASPLPFAGRPAIADNDTILLQRCLTTLPIAPLILLPALPPIPVMNQISLQ
jgi:hypothetical protein